MESDREQNDKRRDACLLDQGGWQNTVEQE
jgi:hypothetical protein